MKHITLLLLAILIHINTTAQESNQPYHESNQACQESNQLLLTNNEWDVPDISNETHIRQDTTTEQPQERWFSMTTFQEITDPDTARGWILIVTYNPDGTWTTRQAYK